MVWFHDEHILWYTRVYGTRGMYCGGSALEGRADL